MSEVRRPTYKLVVLGRCVQTATVVTQLLPQFRTLTLRDQRPAVHWTGVMEGGSLRGVRRGGPDAHTAEVVWVPHPLYPNDPVPEWAKTMEQRLIEESP